MKIYMVILGRGAELEIHAEYPVEGDRNARRKARVAYKFAKAKRDDVRLVCYRSKIPQEIQHARHRSKLYRRIRGHMHALVRLHMSGHPDKAHQARVTAAIERWMAQQDATTILDAIRWGLV